MVGDVLIATNGIFSTEVENYPGESIQITEGDVKKRVTTLIAC